MRTISQICIDADQSKASAYTLHGLKNELAENRYYYPEHEYFFAIEHINSYLQALKEEAVVDKLKAY